VKRSVPHSKKVGDTESIKPFPVSKSGATKVFTKLLRKTTTSTGTSKTTIRSVKSLCRVSDDYNVDAALTVRPVHTVALAGTTVVLQCTTDRIQTTSTPIYWHFIHGRNGVEIVHNPCKLSSIYREMFSVNSAASGQCDLVITNVSLDLAATYRCFDSPGVSDLAALTVIGEWPRCKHDNCWYRLHDTLRMWKYYNMKMVKWKNDHSCTIVTSCSCSWLYQCE